MNNKNTEKKYYKNENTLNELKKELRQLKSVIDLIKGCVMRIEQGIKKK